MKIARMENGFTRKIKDLSVYKKVYYFVFLFFALVFIVSLFISNGWTSKCIIFGSTTDTFMDHLNSVVYNEIDPYENNVIYPPLACLSYKLCNLVIPDDVYGTLVTNPTVKSNSIFMKTEQAFMFPLIIYFLITAVIFVFAIQAIKRGSNFEKVLFTSTLFVSAPFLFAIERGNNILIPLAFSLLFVAWNDSKNRIKKEIALISLAIAVGFKLYPALFAVILISEKRWREFIRLVCYCIMTTILPFFFFYDGFNSIGKMLSSVAGFSTNRTSNLFSFDSNLDFRHIFLFIYSFSQRFTHLELSETLLSLIANVFKYAMALIFGLAALFTKERWKQFTFVACIIYGFPGSVSTYLLLFFVVPIIVLLDTEEKPKVLTFFYVGLLLLTQVPLIIPHDGHFTRYMSTKISSLAVAAMCILAFVELIRILSGLSKRKKTSELKEVAA